MPYAFKDDKSKLTIPNNGNGNWVDAVYPVGSVYLSVNTSGPGYSAPTPAELFGGTWERIPMLHYLMAADANYQSPYRAGQTGGAREIELTPSGTVGDHTLTVNEMPAHSHAYNDKGGRFTTTYAPIDQTPPTREYVVDLQEYGRTTGSAGGGQPHNHTFTGTTQKLTMEPQYLTVNVWVRTA